VTAPGAAESELREVFDGEFKGGTCLRCEVPAFSTVRDCVSSTPRSVLCDWMGGVGCVLTRLVPADIIVD